VWNFFTQTTSFYSNFCSILIGQSLFTASHVANHIWPRDNNFWLHGAEFFNCRQVCYLGSELHHQNIRYLGSEPRCAYFSKLHTRFLSSKRCILEMPRGVWVLWGVRKLNLLLYYCGQPSPHCLTCRPLPFCGHT
jgi:hypothetical protein